MKIGLILALVPSKNYTIFFDLLLQRFNPTKVFIITPYDEEVQKKIVSKYLKKIDFEFLPFEEEGFYKDRSKITRRDLDYLVHVGSLVNEVETIVVGFEPMDLILIRYMAMLKYIQLYLYTNLKEYYVVPLGSSLHSLEMTGFHEFSIHNFIVKYNSLGNILNHPRPALRYYKLYSPKKKKSEELRVICNLGLRVYYTIKNDENLKHKILLTNNSYIHYTYKMYDRTFLKAFVHLFNLKGGNVWGKALMFARQKLINDNERGITDLT